MEIANSYDKKQRFSSIWCLCQPYKEHTQAV